MEEEKLEIEIENWLEEGIRKFKERLDNVTFEREGVKKV